MDEERQKRYGYLNKVPHFLESRLSFELLFEARGESGIFGEVGTCHVPQNRRHDAMTRLLFIDLFTPLFT